MKRTKLLFAVDACLIILVRVVIVDAWDISYPVLFSVLVQEDGVIRSDGVTTQKMKMMLILTISESVEMLYA